MNDEVLLAVSWGVLMAALVVLWMATLRFRAATRLYNEATRLSDEATSLLNQARLLGGLDELTQFEDSSIIRVHGDDDDAPTKTKPPAL